MHERAAQQQQALKATKRAHLQKLTALNQSLLGSPSAKPYQTVGTHATTCACPCRYHLPLASVNHQRFTLLSLDAATIGYGDKIIAEKFACKLPQVLDWFYWG